MASLTDSIRAERAAIGYDHAVNNERHICALLAEVDRLTARVAEVEQARAGDVAGIVGWMRLRECTAEGHDARWCEACERHADIADAIERGDWRDAPLPPDPRDARIAARALADVIVEREKQRIQWGNDHDDEHDGGDLAAAAAVLAHPTMLIDEAPEWAFVLADRTSDDRRKQLVIAAALCLAEIERLGRKST